MVFVVTGKEFSVVVVLLGVRDIRILRSFCHWTSKHWSLLTYVHILLRLSKAIPPYTIFWPYYLCLTGRISVNSCIGKWVSLSSSLKWMSEARASLKEVCVSTPQYARAMHFCFQNKSSSIFATLSFPLHAHCVKTVSVPLPLLAHWGVYFPLDVLRSIIPMYLSNHCCRVCVSTSGLSNLASRGGNLSAMAADSTAQHTVSRHWIIRHSGL